MTCMCGKNVAKVNSRPVPTSFLDNSRLCGRVIDNIYMLSIVNAHMRLLRRGSSGGTATPNRFAEHDVQVRLASLLSTKSYIPYVRAFHMYAYVQVHSNATRGGTVLVRGSTFGVASHHGAALIHVAGTESVVIEDSVFHGEGGGDANTGVSSSVGFRLLPGSNVHSVFADTGRGDPNMGPDTHAKVAAESSYGSGTGLDTHRGLTTGEIDGPAHGSYVGNARAIFAGPEVELSVTGSTFALGSDAAVGPVAGGALSCHGAVIRGCTFVVAGACSEVGVSAHDMYIFMFVTAF